MSYTGIIVLIFAIIATCKVRSACDTDICNDACNRCGMNGGTCKGNDCECSSGKSCLDVVCDAICSVAELTGECENNQCICKAEIEPCGLDECVEPCIQNAPPGCIFVEPLSCMKFGPITSCGCLCWEYNKSNYIFSAKAKKSPRFHRDYYRYTVL